MPNRIPRSNLQGIRPDETKSNLAPYRAYRSVERIYRDVRVCQIYEGANDIQRLVIGRAVAGD